MKAIKFNTGRGYTPSGQVIVYWIVNEREDEFGEHATVRFFDEARNITGEIEALYFISDRRVLESYDGGFYKEVSHMPGVEEEKALALAATV